MNAEIINKVINLIEYESEHSHLDFKQEQYPIDRDAHDKHEFIKDMVAFANLPSKEDKYIIIGVKEMKGKTNDFLSIDDPIDQSSYQQYLNQYIDPHINFDYLPFTYKNHQLAYFRLYNNYKFPYLFKEDFKKKGQVIPKTSGFIRSGTSTIPLERQHLEDIYSFRHSIKDRKEDVLFQIKDSKYSPLEMELRKKYNYLSLDLINQSNKSININIELKIRKSNNHKIELKDAVTKRIELDKLEPMARSIVSSSMPPPSLLSSSITKLGKCIIHRNSYDYDVIEVISQQHNSSSLTINQESTFSDVLEDQIAIGFTSDCELEIEITLRSDEFTEGPLAERVTIPLKHGVHQL